MLRGRSARVRERAKGTAEGGGGSGPDGAGSGSGGGVTSEGAVGGSGAGESESVAERDLSRVLFCKKRGSGEAFLPDILQPAGVMFHVTQSRKRKSRRDNSDVSLPRSMKSAFIALLSAAAFNNVAATPVVNVSLRTSWHAPPFLVQLLYVHSHCITTSANYTLTRESFALELPTSFFPLLDAFSSGNFVQNASASRIRNVTIQTALEKGILKDPTDVAAVDSTLALHAATPTVQAFYSFYEDRYGAEGGVCLENGKETQGQAWVDWYGRVVCTAHQLQEVINETSERHVFIYSFVYHQTDRLRSKHSRPKLLAFDHIHPPPSRSLVRPSRTAILYASLDRHAWNLKELHDALYSNNGVEYVFRYIPPRRDSDEGKKSYLTGYGVALDLKKTDYLVLDDRHSGSSGKCHVCATQ